MASAGSITIFLGANTLGLKRGIQDVKTFERQVLGSTAKMSANFASLSMAIKATGAAMTRFLTLPIALAGGVGSSMFSDFEFELSKVTGLVGIADKQTQEWGKQILKLAPQVGKMPKELAEGLYFVTSAGIRGAETMEVLEYAAKASAVGMGEVKDIVNITAAAMNAYGKENLSAAQAVDIVTMTIREGMVEADKLAGSMGVVLPIAAEMGVTFAQVGAAIAGMTRTGTTASTATMQLRQMLMKLLKPATHSKKAIDVMGSSFNELRKTIREKGLLAALTDMKKMTEIFGEDAITQLLPRMRALMAHLDLTGKNFAKNKVIFKNTADAIGTLDKAYANVSLTMHQKWNVAAGAISVTMIELGAVMKETLIPIISSFVKKAAEVADWLRELSTEQAHSLTKWLLWAAALGPILLLLGSMIGAILKIITVVKSLGMVIIFLRKQMFRAVLLAWMNPITASIMAIAALVGVIVGLVSYTKKQADAQSDFNDELEKTNKNLSGFEKIMKRIKTLSANDIFEKMREEMRKLPVNTIQDPSMFPVDPLATNMDDYWNTQLGIDKTPNFITPKELKLIKDYAKDVATLDEVTELYNTLQTDQKDILKGLLKGKQGLVDNSLEENKAILKNSASYQVAIDYLEQYKKKVDELLEAQLKSERSLARDEVNKNLKAKIQTLETLDTYLSNFKLNEKKVRAYTGALQDLIEIGGTDTTKLQELADMISVLTIGMTEAAYAAGLIQTDVSMGGYTATASSVKTSEELKRITDGSKEAKQGLMDMTEWMKENLASIKIIKQFDDLNWKIEKLGVTTDLLSEKLRLQKKVMSNLLNMKRDDITNSDEWIASISLARIEITKTKDEMVILELQLAGNMAMVDSFGQALYSLGSVFSDLGGDSALGKFGDALTKVGKIIGNIITLIEAVKTITLIYRAVTGAMTPAILTEAAATEVLATAQASLAVNTAIAMAAMMGYPALLMTIPTAVATTMAALALGKAGAVGLESGGMVPGGYPNDSFPAMLSSHETVIPLEKLSQFQNGGDGDVNFIIEGRQLEGVLQKQNALNTAF